MYTMCVAVQLSVSILLLSVASTNSSSRVMVTTWSPLSLLSSGRYALCLLNQPVVRPASLVRLWNAAQYRVAVDGGTNVWTEILASADGAGVMTRLAPDLITGDLDSADALQVDKFRRQGSEVLETPDQNSTDFTKCLGELGRRQEQLGGLEGVVAWCEVSGRLDQVLANLQTLHLAGELLPWPIYLAASSSLTWLLPPGRHRILPAGAGAHCGLVPLAGPATVSTTGLAWDLRQHTLQFGGLVSTSNGFQPGAECVTVETDAALLWTMDWEQQL